MVKCLFERSTGLYSGGTRYDDLPHDPATHIQIVLSDFPDKRRDRWNGAEGTRLATAQELANVDAAEADTAATQDIDGVKVLKALVIWLAPLVGKTPVQARNEIIAIYKSL